MLSKHPNYLLLRQRSGRLAWLWWLGHLGRRVALAGAVLVPPGWLAASWEQRKSAQAPATLWPGSIQALACLAVCAGLLVASVILKNFALKRGGRY